MMASDIRADALLGVRRRKFGGAGRVRGAMTWAHDYARRIALTDAVIVTAAVLVALVVRFGREAIGYSVGMQLFAGGLVLAWACALRIGRSYDRRIFGSGSQEYSRVATACFTVFGLLAIVDLLFQLGVARGFVALALPIGSIGLLLSRWLWRKWLCRSRKATGCRMDKVLVVGGETSAMSLVHRLINTPELGYDVVGICLPSGAESAHDSLRIGDRVIPVRGDFDDVAAAVSRSSATIVAVTSAEALGHQAMQDLSWDLEGLSVDMVVAPGVMDIAGPRILVRPVAGLPLLHVDKPQYAGANKTLKALVDWFGAALLLLAFAPVLLSVAIAVKVDSRGPVFYRATRVGLNNKSFRMWKFRSMVVGADLAKVDLTDRDEGAGVLFKVREDPRVTRVGRIIRRYSLDELPQLFNVLGGSMSMVGPRPPLPEEVRNYDGRIARRMLVKPGMTGLWQVSGRSDLPWEEAVRLDLSYVENWSIMQDAVILWRTLRAVVSRSGAY
ncbi:exopolysaccharide biosynthesis polyprenyl glycosylphosphotransferase [Gordonia pseudamarae]|jgi:exopolysaccharide biosynthesis polyprenyl glycosylphosphotransferase|uniref:Exopolysaccharide biosynthesis polyprenyl glycosylphosphotransferase n=2 Tax=Gordoniaceae TaxID=85026 RepID=A0ABX6ILG0_9ACTN|nr:sugar transferase [Gordonia sp. (in: high G+C Gram-positive bacteria)]QHN27644.1 exopolysaccharide biosynthesis polyprenyl glycosylphosphotransferase [Gordonia pseudamarae]QHN36526.1 exopolysaccharide biosynthesis polyprenyl glycosylphosphotransferase [Gordonia pseudamarae]